jgi:Domain of unknown function (DUF1877)
MGVGFNMLTISTANIERLLADPPLVHRFLEPNDESPYLVSLGVGVKPGLIARLRGVMEAARPATIPDLSISADERERVDLDKSWDGWNFMLGKVRPERRELQFIDSGGTEVGKVDATGYGTPAKVFRPNEVLAVAKALADLDVQAIRAAYVAEELVVDNVYPRGLWRDDPRVVDYLLEHFTAMKRFVLRAASGSLGMLTHAY